MKGHFHNDALFYLVTAAGVLVVAHVARRVAAAMVSSDNPSVQNVGKAVGGFFSLPAA